jgi:hypothetical protein
MPPRIPGVARLAGLAPAAGGLVPAVETEPRHGVARAGLAWWGAVEQGWAAGKLSVGKLCGHLATKEIRGSHDRPDIPSCLDCTDF